MSEPILICYDDSPDAVRAIEAAAALLWEGVVDVVDDLGAAVIAIGSTGLTGMKKILDASFSQQIAEHAGRPVLIVPPPR